MATYRVVDEDGDYYETEGDPCDALTEAILRADDAEDERDQARAELEQLRVQLGETETHWGLNVPSWQLPGHRDDVTRYPDEQTARGGAVTVRRSGVEANVRIRLVGDWRDADGATTAVEA